MMIGIGRPSALSSRSGGEGFFVFHVVLLRVGSDAEHPVLDEGSAMMSHAVEIDR